MVALVSCIAEQHNLQLLRIAVCLWVAGIMLGGTIWATHFLAMLAYSVPASCRLFETGASVLIAVAISSLATFVLVCIPNRRGQWQAAA